VNDDRSGGDGACALMWSGGFAGRGFQPAIAWDPAVPHGEPGLAPPGLA
jgi:hypothetical protein